MANITLGRDGTRRQDGLSADEWIAELFEYEYCNECGRDAEDHAVTLDIFGLFHANCKFPPE